MPPSDLPRFPQLPIVQLTEVERKTTAEKYGSFYYVSAIGLIAFMGLIVWFAWSAWTMRDVWASVYTLHDASRSEADRINAARMLAADSRVNQRQLYDISLRRDLPPLARAIAAQALTSEAIRDDPRAYALAVARSEGWPDWLRLLMLRPLAEGAGEGLAINQEALRELSEHADPVIRRWAEYTIAESIPDDPGPIRLLTQAAERGDAQSPLASRLLEALKARGDHRARLLRGADDWTRANHSQLSAVLRGSSSLP